MFTADKLSPTERSLHRTAVYSLHLAVSDKKRFVRDMVGALVFGDNVPVKVPEVITFVSEITAVIQLLVIWLVTVRSGLLHARLLVVREG